MSHPMTDYEQGDTHGHDTYIHVFLNYPSLDPGPSRHLHQKDQCPLIEPGLF